jgi:RimJ/RimL family protein N-acetyltransferase
MLIELRPAETEEDFALIADLARDIWLEHYDGIVDLAQIEYMLETIQSQGAISGHVKQGYLYSIVLVDHEPAGYLSLLLDRERREVFLSKFYLAAPYRNRGVGRRMLSFVEKEGARMHCLKIRLTVNRNNIGSIAAYERMGFTRKGELKTDIGRGYIMDDYELVKAIPFGAGAG